MQSNPIETVESSAARVALWRALHVQVDAPPHVLDDSIGLRLVAPDDDWRKRPDMHPEGTRLFRASIVGRARFIEDLVVERAQQGVDQYVILGAGLDSFAHRKPAVADAVKVFEIDQPGPQAWKRRRLGELDLPAPHFVAVDFEANDDWWERLAAAGFDAGKPVVVAASGVSMYLTRDAVMATLRRVATLAPGSTFAMTFLVPIEHMGAEIRPGFEIAAKGARASGTPFISFFTPQEMLQAARDAGFRQARHVSADELAARYFANRTDGLRPPGSAEELLVATT